MIVPETEIIITRDGAEIARTTVRPGDYVIGSDAVAEISIDAEGVADRHAQLIVNYSEIFIEDLGSGIFIGGKAVRECTRLWPSQKVQIGSVVIETRKVKSASDSDQSLAPQAATVRRVLPEEFLRGRKYEIGGLIAQGGMGAVLDAHEAATKRTVAMKVMLSNMSEGDVLRFIEEAQITSQLEHPNIVPVHELGVDEHDQVFYTMKLVQGVTLRRVLEKLRAGDAATVAAYPLRRLLIVMMRVCDAMAFAHSKGVIHRDLKPDNVMIGDFGEVLVMDWGLAKVLGAPETDGAGGSEPVAAALSGNIHSVREGEAESFTMAGSVVGTPHYMSPEQARGDSETLDERCDIWALGAILRHVLTLEKPVPGETVDEIVENVREGRLTPIPPRAAHCPGGRVPEALIAVTEKAQALHRDERYPSVVLLREDIDAWLGGFATKAEHAGLAKQLLLLVQRHKGIFSTAAAAWLLITALAVWFVLGLRASEKAAKDAQSIAVQKEAETSKALARSALSLADAALRESNGPAMQAALHDVPDTLRDSTWRYLLDQSDTSIARIRTDADEIDGTVAHPRLPGVFAVGDRAGKVTFLNVRTGEKLLTFAPAFPSNEPSTNYRLAISPDGERIAVARRDGGGIVIHNARDGRVLSAWDAPATERIAFSADGKRLLQTAVENGNFYFLNIWETPAGHLAWTYRSSKPTPVGTHGAFTPDGKQIVTYGFGDDFRVLNATDGEIIRSFKNNRRVVTILVTGADNKMAAGDRTGSVAIYDILDGRIDSEFHVQEKDVEFLTVTADGAGIVTAETMPDGRQSIQVWKPGTGARIHSLLGGSGPIHSIAIHPVSGEVLIGGTNSRAWSLNAFAATWKLTRAGESRSAAFWGADDLLFSPEPGNGIALRRLQPGGSEVVWKENSYGPTVGVSADGRLAAVAIDDRISILKSTATAPESIATIKTDLRAKYVHLSPTGDRVAVVKFYGWGLKLFDTTTGTEPVRFERPDIKKYHDCAWLGGDRLLALLTVNAERGNAGSEERIVLWDARSGDTLRTAVHTGPMDVLAVAPDGRRFAEAGADKRVRIRDAATLAILHEFRVHDGPITALAWHPTRPILATASSDLAIRLWDVETGARLDEFRGPGSAPSTLTFSPSGKRLACAAIKESTRIWEPPILGDKPAAPDAGPAENAATVWFHHPITTLPTPKPGADGWADLLPVLTPAMLAQAGNGWHLKNGRLLSPSTKYATLPLPADLTGASYQVRITVTQTAPKDVFHVVLPVGDTMTGFELDGWAGQYTGLCTVDGKTGKDLPGVIKGRQVNDSAPHELEITVRPDDARATITATLDTRPLYEWTGPTAALGQHEAWATTQPGFLAIGAFAGDWAVSGVKVKRLAK